MIWSKKEISATNALESIPLAVVRADSLKLDAELAKLEKKMAAYLKELGY